MDTRSIAVALFALTSVACAAQPVMEPRASLVPAPPWSSGVPVLAERTVSLYSDHQTIPVPTRAPTTALGVETPDQLHIRAIVVRFENGDEATVTTKTHGRVLLPGPARRLREVELQYASEAPPDTFAKVRLYDLSIPDELQPPVNVAAGRY